jgi:hypothetical protein
MYGTGDAAVMMLPGMLQQDGGDTAEQCVTTKHCITTEQCDTAGQWCNERTAELDCRHCGRTTDATINSKGLELQTVVCDFARKRQREWFT